MKQLLLISITLMLLFVVVCPLTPTPTAVVNGKIASHLHPMAVVVASLAVVFISRYFVISQSDEVVTQGAHDVLQLTCVRLC